MSMRADYASQLTLTETLTGSYVSSQDNTITLNGMNSTGTLNGTTTPAVSKGTSYQAALVSGSKTIDLTSLPGLTADETITLSGLIVQYCKLRNLSTNSNPITIVQGASNGYHLLGTTFSITLGVGQEILINTNNGAPTVGSGARTLDVTGTGAQILEVTITAG